jgi:hypothetical protein
MLHQLFHFVPFLSSSKKKDHICTQPNLKPDPVPLRERTDLLLTQSHITPPAHQLPSPTILGPEGMFCLLQEGQGARELTCREREQRTESEAQRPGGT